MPLPLAILGIRTAPEAGPIQLGSTGLSRGFDEVVRLLESLSTAANIEPVDKLLQLEELGDRNDTTIRQSVVGLSLQDLHQAPSSLGCSPCGVRGVTVVR